MVDGISAKPPLVVKRWPEALGIIAVVQTGRVLPVRQFGIARSLYGFHGHPVAHAIFIDAFAQGVDDAGKFMADKKLPKGGCLACHG